MDPSICGLGPLYATRILNVDRTIGCLDPVVSTSPRKGDPAVRAPQLSASFDILDRDGAVARMGLIDPDAPRDSNHIARPERTVEILVRRLGRDHGLVAGHIDLDLDVFEALFGWRILGTGNVDVVSIPTADFNRAIHVSDFQTPSWF